MRVSLFKGFRLMAIISMAICFTLPGIQLVTTVKVTELTKPPTVIFEGSSESWWNENFAYRKEHNITGSSVGDQTDYQVGIKVYYGSGDDGTETVYLNNHSQPDFDDIRFTWYNATSGQEQEIDYWLEEKHDQDNATFWVEIPEINNVTNNTIYIYYGNSTVSTTSNGENTFIFFDHFLGNSLDTDKWTLLDATEISYSVSNSEINFSGTGTSLGVWTEESVYHNSIEITDNYMFEARVRASIITSQHKAGIFLSQENKKVGWGEGSSSRGILIYLQHWSGESKGLVEHNCRAEWKFGLTSFSDIYADEQPVTTSYRVYGISKSGSNFRVFHNRDEKGSQTDGGLTNNYIILFNSITYGTANHIFDWALMRKYVSPEPTHGDWGEEEIVTTVSVSPSSVIGPPPNVGENFTIDINVENVVDLYTWEIGLEWNPSVLECLNFTPDYSFFGPKNKTLLILGTINNTIGKIYPPYSCTLTTHAGVNGSGTLATIEFRVKAYGNSTLNLITTLFDSTITMIPIGIVDGYFELPPNDVAVVGVTIALPYGAEACYPGWVVYVTVVVENQGSETENFTVTTYYNSNPIETKNITNLAPRANITLTFTWNTTGVDPCPYNYTAKKYIPYNISANASLVNDYDPTDNYLVDGTLVIRLPADGSGDGHCAGADLGIMGRSWYGTYPDPHYDWRADYSGDGAVTGADLGILGRNWYRY